MAPRLRLSVQEVRVMSDAEGWGKLMVAAQRGHGGAYRRLLEELRPWLVRYYHRRLPPAMLEDVVQDALIAIHEKRHTFDGERPFGPWLSAIARYKWIDRLRQIARHPEEALEAADISAVSHEAAVTSATVLNRLLASLKPPQAEAIRLAKLDGLSIAEVAARTGQSASLVKVNIHRGLARLARVVQDGRSDDVD